MSVAGAVLVAAQAVLWPRGLNSSFYLDVNNFARHTAWAHGFMHAYALWLGLALMVVLFALAFALAWWHRDVRAVVLLVLGGAGTLVALGLNQLVGHAAAELRPYDTYHHALVLVAKANDYSFPSDHAVVAGALFTALLLAVRRAAPDLLQARGAARSSISRPARATRATVSLVVAGAVLGLLLLFARVYVGAHYPGDVVAGALLGCAVVLVLSALRPLGYRVAHLGERTPLRILFRRPQAGRAASETGADKGGRTAVM